MRKRGWWLGGILGLVVASLAVGLLAWPSGHARAAPRQASAAQRKPNIVFVLTDDLDWSLVRFMPHVKALMREGTTFNHYIVADSLCCPSRATIFTGLFPHDTGVVNNTEDTGGYHAFVAHKDEQKTYAVATQRAGYWNSMLGKYLNGYGDSGKHRPSPVPGEPDIQIEKMATNHVPPGWKDWHVSNFSGYREHEYWLNDNGGKVFYGPGHAGGSMDYMTDVLGRHARDFINRAARNHKPFVMEVATFAPHKPLCDATITDFTVDSTRWGCLPAPEDLHRFPGLRAPRGPSFNQANKNPPRWLLRRVKGKPAPLPRLNKKQLREIDNAYRARARSVLAVDRLVAKLETQLRARGLAGNTYIVFSSDNGYHLGQHRLLWAKETAFDTDIRVPLVIAGPGVPHGRIASQPVQNVDLYPTFVQIAGGQLGHAVDGQSLLPLLRPQAPRPLWRTVAYFEHSSPPLRTTAHPPTSPTVGATASSGLPPILPAKFDPDLDSIGGRNSPNPKPYRGIRLFNKQFGNAVYVEYTLPFSNDHEYYNIAKDPGETNNIYASLSGAQKLQLHNILVAFATCHNAIACWSAGQPQ